MTSERTETIRQYWQPDPDLVETLDKGGVKLSYVSHVHTQATLDQIDPDWYLDLVCDERGVPVIERRQYELTKRDGTVYARGTTLTLWGRLTLLGVTRWGVGSVEANKPDAEKELVGDLLRNAAMRHGVFAGLWAKERHHSPSQAAPRFIARTAADVPDLESRAARVVADVFPDADGEVIDWTDNEADQIKWTEHHLARISSLLPRTTPARIHDRIVKGLRERQHIEAESWVEVPPDMWVDSVLSFEKWAEKQAKERVQ